MPNRGSTKEKVQPILQWENRLTRQPLLCIVRAAHAHARVCSVYRSIPFEFSSARCSGCEFTNLESLAVSWMHQNRTTATIRSVFTHQWNIMNSIRFDRASWCVSWKCSPNVRVKCDTVSHSMYSAAHTIAPSSVRLLWNRYSRCQWPDNIPVERHRPIEIINVCKRVSEQFQQSNESNARERACCVCRWADVDAKN